MIKNLVKLTVIYHFIALSNEVGVHYTLKIQQTDIMLLDVRTSVDNSLSAFYRGHRSRNRERTFLYLNYNKKELHNLEDNTGDV